VRVATAFDGRDDAILGLSVEIANTDHWELEVDPSQFTFTTCSGESLDDCNPTRPVLSPERMLTVLDQRRQRAAGQEAVGVAVVLVALGALFFAAASQSGDPKADPSCDHDHYHSSDSRVVLPRPDPVRDAWARFALRPSKIAPGAAVGGAVFIPIDPHARYVWLHVRAAEQWFSFRYRQTVTAPRRIPR
jgi:hypothetical protein